MLSSPFNSSNSCPWKREWMTEANLHYIPFLLFPLTLIILVVSGLCDQHIFNKEKKQMKYEAYMEEYVDLVKRFTEAQDKYNKLMDEQVDRNRQSIKLQAFINEIKATDTLNLEFNDKFFNLTIINIKVYKDSHLEFNFKDGSVINIEL